MVINWDFSIVSYKFIGLNVESFRNGKKFPFISLVLMSFDVKSNGIFLVDTLLIGEHHHDR